MQDLIIIHGAIGASDQMRPLGEKLSRNFTIHYLELDGHGTRSKVAIEFKVDHFTDQLKSFIDGLGLNQVHIFGYSMGGFIALIQAANGDRRVASVFTLGTKLTWTSEVASGEAKRLNPDKMEEKIPAFAEILKSRHGKDQWRSVLSSTASLLQSLGESNPIHEGSMSSILCPVHLCVADQDEMVTEEETALVKGMIKKGVYSRLSNSKHPIEQVDLVALANKVSYFVSSL